jgi:ABC-type antimicrobial peptide transport system permease subunit
LPLGFLLQSTGISGGEFVESLHLGSSYPFLLTGRTLLFAFVFGALVAVVGSFYAAVANTKMKIVETLRHN